MWTRTGRSQCVHAHNNNYNVFMSIHIQYKYSTIFLTYIQKQKIYTTSNIHTCGTTHGFHAIQMVMNTVQINSKHKCK